MLAESGEAAVAVVVCDGQCPLCSREIARYRRRLGAERLTWIDANRDEAELASLGLDRAATLARFHVRDAAGQWHIGGGGFVLLWSLLTAYRWLAMVILVLHLQPLLDWGYERFLRWRGSRRCMADRCSRGVQQNG